MVSITVNRFVDNFVSIRFCLCLCKRDFPCVLTEYTFAALPRTARGTPLVLGGDPKGRNFLYTNGNSVIIRDIENPAIADVYTEHSCQVNVAKYSPSGFYIASGGKVVWKLLAFTLSVQIW